MEKFDFIDSKFRYAIIAAKRAKQIVKGSRKRIETDFQNPLTIAIDEVSKGKVNFQVIDRTNLDFTAEDEITAVKAPEGELILDGDDSQQVSDMKDLLLADTNLNEDAEAEVKEE